MGYAGRVWGQNENEGHPKGSDGDAGETITGASHRAEVLCFTRIVIVEASWLYSDFCSRRSVYVNFESVKYSFLLYFSKVH